MVWRCVFKNKISSDTKIMDPRVKPEYDEQGNGFLGNSPRMAKDKNGYPIRSGMTREKMLSSDARQENLSHLSSLNTRQKNFFPLSSSDAEQENFSPLSSSDLIRRSINDEGDIPLNNLLKQKKYNLNSNNLFQQKGYNMKQTNLSQSGRSMVEMLGVLAVMGVLSIGAVMGFNYGMNKHRANQVLSDIRLIYQETRMPSVMHNIVNNNSLPENLEIEQQSAYDYSFSFPNLDDFIYDAPEESEPDLLSVNVENVLQSKIMVMLFFILQILQEYQTQAHA